MRKLSALLVLTMLTFLVGGAQAQISEAWGSSSFFDTGNEVTINSAQYVNTDSGWFRSDGIHFAGVQNYFTGYCSPSDCSGSGYFHGYFAFDLTSFAGNANSASFTVNNYGIGPDPGTLTLYGTTLMPSDVNSQQSWDGIGKYNALNVGPIIGSIALTHNDSNKYSTITLNSDGLAWLDSHAGQGAVIGTHWDAAPEPSSMVLLGTGLVCGFSMLRRKVW